VDCAATESALMDYHFSVASQEQRDGVHAHLRDCPECARRYLELKYAIDSGAAMSVRPSARTRARLRAEVATMFPPTRLKRVRLWMARPMPRYQVAATMVCMLLLVFAGVFAGWRGQPGSSGPVLAQKQDPTELREPEPVRRGPRHSFEAVDSARPMAVSLTYY
jgi:anti-sigma factor RsiW